MSRTSYAQADIALYSRKIGNNKTSATQYQVVLTNFRDPMGRRDLRGLPGTNKRVKDFIKDDRRFKAIVDYFRMVAYDVVKQQKHTYVSITFEDCHGRYISPAVTELVADALEADGYKVMVQHYELPKQ